MISDEFERHYNARLAVPDHATWFDAWKTESVAARQELVCQLDIAYDNEEKGSLDFFSATQKTGARPSLIFIHGGYWKAMDKSDYSWIARPWVQQGAHVLVINYMLCPKATIGEIVKQVRRGYRWIVDHSATLGLDPSRLTLVGHSAGAHLAAAILTDPQLPAPSAILGLSGIYDLTPLVQTSMNQELKLDEPIARALSPLLSDRPKKSCRLHLYDGGLESLGFHDQTNRLAQAWGAEAYGQLAGLHHFSILDPLKDEKSMLFQCCKRLIDNAA